jgi:hypothetical protein
MSVPILKKRNNYKWMYDIKPEYRSFIRTQYNN